MHRILIVDDEPDVVKLGAMGLKKAGYDVSTAEDGEEALTRVREFVPDLIILDVRLPKLDGFEVFKILQDDAKLATIPVVFATADATVNLKDKLAEHPDTSFLLKPYSTQEVLEKIKVHLG